MVGRSGLEHGQAGRRRPIVAFAATACAVVAMALGAVPAAGASTTTTTTATTTPCASPQFVVIPESVTVTAGQPASFAAASPDSCFTPTAVIGTSEWEVSTDGGVTWAPVAGSAAPILSTGTESTSLTVPDTTVAMSGDEYRAVFSASTGTTTTPAATLTVLPATTTTTSSSSTSSTASTTTTTSSSTSTTATTTPCASPQIAAVPQSETVTAGQSATFALVAPVACFTPTAVIGTAEWQVSTDGGVTWSLVAGSVTQILSSGSESTSLTVADTTLAMSGFEYRAVLLSLAGDVTLTTLPATLTVVPGVTSTTTSSTPTTTSTTVTTTTSSTTMPPSAALPSVTGVTPSSGDAYSLVIISGLRFNHARSVQFAAKRALFLTLRSNLIIAVAPRQPKGAVDVTVSTIAGTSPTSSADTFTYLD